MQDFTLVNAQNKDKKRQKEDNVPFLSFFVV